MAKVTYYLGAGASAKSLPTYANFKSRFALFVALLPDKNFLELYGKNNGEYLQALYEASKRILNELEFHNTPDTLAKKYFHQKKTDDLKLLKIVLIVFFYYEQTVNKPDLRYDSLVASILEPQKGLIKISNDYRVISWNYDFQFELTYKNYAEIKQDEIFKDLCVFPDILSPRRRYDIESNFSIVHINGIAYSETIKYSPLIDREKLFLNFSEIFKQYYWGDSKSILGFDSISYAWEDEEINKDNVNQAIKIARETETLVIIGYSFPVFNRKVDSIILSSMNKVRKVYVQNTDPAVRENVFKIFFDIYLNDEDVIHVSDCNTFYLPT